MFDALRGYVQLASGLVEVSVSKARDVAESLLAGGLDQVVPEVPGKDTAAGAARAMGSQVQDLADDLVTQATANRELLIGLVRTEVDRTAGRLGFVREEELAAVRRHLSRLETQVTDLHATVGEGGTTPPRATARAAAAATVPPRAAPKKKSPAKKKTAVKPVSSPAKTPSNADATPDSQATAATTTTDGP